MQRPGNQAQLSLYVKDLPPEHRTLRQIVLHITGNLDADLGKAALAARAASANATSPGSSSPNSASLRPVSSAPPAVRPPPACWSPPPSR